MTPARTSASPRSWLDELRARASRYESLAACRRSRQREDTAGEVGIETGSAWEYPGDAQVRVHFLDGRPGYHEIDHASRFRAVAITPDGTRAFVARCVKDPTTSQPPPGEAWSIVEVPTEAARRESCPPRTLAQVYPLQSMDVTPDGTTLDVASGRLLVRHDLTGSGPSVQATVSTPQPIDFVDHLSDGTVVMCPQAFGGLTYPRALFVLRPGESAVRRVGVREANPQVWRAGMAPYARCVPAAQRDAIVASSPFVDEDGLLRLDVPGSAVFSPRADAMAAVQRGQLVLWDAPQAAPRTLRADITRDSNGGPPAIGWTADGAHVIVWTRGRTEADGFTVTVADRDGREVTVLPGVQAPALEGDAVSFDSGGERRHLDLPAGLKMLAEQDWYLDLLATRLLGAAPRRPHAEAPTVTQETDYIVAGGVRIPRRVEDRA